MQTITDLKRRALELREKTQVESITPDEVGTLAYDTLEAIENEQRSGASLGIRKTYVSIEAMEADAERPVDDKGTPLRRGMLANIYNPDDPESEDNGKVYSFENPGWAYRQYVTSGVASKRELDDAKKGANYQVIVFTKDVSTTRLLVPLANRKPGYMITYNPGTGWIEERYTGTLSIDSEWQKNENWKQTVSNENIENIALNAQAQASEAAKQAAFAKEQADRLAAIDLSLYRVVTDLPTQDIDEDKIYLKISTKTGENNKYDEYVYVDGAWELLGQYEAAIDLTQYVGKKELQSEIGKLPELANVSKFVCLDNEGKLAGVMSKEDVAKVLGELIGISNLRTAFNLKKLSLKKGETGDIGYVSGLMTIMHSWSSASPNIIYVDTFNHKYTSVAGKEIEKMPLTVSWKGTGWDSIMQITSIYEGTSDATEFTVAFQSIQ